MVVLTFDDQPDVSAEPTTTTPPIGGGSVLTFEDIDIPQTVASKEEVELPDIIEETDDSFLKKVGSIFIESEKRFGQTIGDTLASITGTAKRVREAQVAEADARFRLSKALREARPEQKERIKQQLDQGTFVQDVEDIIPSVGKTTKQIFGEAAGVLLDTVLAGEVSALRGVPGAKKITQIAQKIKRGAGIGAGFGFTTALQEGKEGKDLVLPTVLGGGFGIAAEVGLPVALKLTGSLARGATKGAFSLTKKGARRLSETKVAERAAQELGPILEKAKSGVRRFTTSIETNLEKMGEEGKQIADGLSKIRKETFFEAGDDILKLKKRFDELSESEILNFVDVAEGTQKSLSNKVNEAVSVWRDIAKKIAVRAQESNLQIKLSNGAKVPFVPRENFVPHYIPQEEIVRLRSSETAQQKLFENMVQQGTVENVAQAKKVFDDYMSKRMMGRYGHLERSREIDFPIFEKDPRKFIFDYIFKATERIKRAEFFGGDDGKVNELITKAKDAGKNWEEIQKLYRRAVGDEFFDPTAVDLSRKIRAVELITKLGLGAITNAGQIANTITRTGLLPALRAQLIDVLKKENRLWAQRAGNLEAIINKQAQEAGAKGNITSRFLDAVGFSKVELNNRNVAANAGKNYAQILFKKLKQQQKGQVSFRLVESKEFLERRLKQLGIDPQKALRKERLSDKDLQNAGFKLIEQSQFIIDPKDLPFYWSGPGGKIATQFKSFAFQQGKFIKRQIVDELKQGNMKPLLLYIAASQAVGEPVGDLKAFVRRRDRPTGAERVADNFLTIGGMGLLTDFVSSIRWGTAGGGLLKFLAGPALSDFDRVAAGIGSAVFNGSFKPLSRTILQNIPVVGAPLKQTIFPTKQKLRAKTIPLAEEIFSALGL